MIKHLACIMDGNRRWATSRGLPASVGHKEGIKAVEHTVNFCLKNSIAHVTFYAFSIENFKRSYEEKKYIFNLVIDYFKNDTLQAFIDKNIRILFIGDRSLFPHELLDHISDIEEKTAHGTTLSINILFCYGGQQEIIAATKKIALAVKDGIFTIDTINEETIKKHLWMPAIPDPELIIRSGGMQRLSNCLLFQSAYTELYFTPVLWPDITEMHLTDAFNYFKKCQKNVGA